MAKKAVEKENATTLDILTDYYLRGWDDAVLSDQQETIRKRLESVFGKLLDGYTQRQAKEFLSKEWNISYMQAHRDCNMALKLFGDVIESNKEAYRHIIYEHALKTFQLAAKASDLGEMNRAITNMIKLKGLDRDEGETQVGGKNENNYALVVNIEGQGAKKVKLDDMPQIPDKEKNEILQALEDKTDNIQEAELVQENDDRGTSA